MADNYQIENSQVVYRGTVRKDKESEAVKVEWTFDFSNVQDTTKLYKMAVEPSGLVVKAQAKWRRGKVSAKATFDVQADFLENSRPRKSKAEKVREEMEKMSAEDREALLASLQGADTNEEG